MLVFSSNSIYTSFPLFYCFPSLLSAILPVYLLYSYPSCCFYSTSTLFPWPFNSLVIPCASLFPSCTSSISLPFPLPYSLFISFALIHHDIFVPLQHYILNLLILSHFFTRISSISHPSPLLPHLFSTFMSFSYVCISISYQYCFL